MFSRKPAKPGRLDSFLYGSGFGLAAASIVFAAVAIANRGRPNVVGMEYLAIFAKPNGARRTVATADARQVAGRAEPAIDPTPTGSIPGASLAETLRKGAPEMIEVRDGVAWIRVDDSIVAVTPGKAIEGLGVVEKIVQRRDRWLLLGPGGEVLLTMRRAADDSSRPAAFAAKSLVLGEP